MREIAIAVAGQDAETVIGRLIVMAPYGILVDERDDEVVLRIRAGAAELPPATEFTARAGDALRSVHEREVPDDWPARRRLDYRADPVGDICVRPLWAPATSGLVDIAIEETDAFGSGLHPTTRDCIALLSAVERRGALADLGCGSGVLSIVAAKLGFAPVTAVDVREGAVQATRRNAAHNAVEIAATTLDLLTVQAPFAPVILVNVPAEVHAAVARSLPAAPDVAIVSGILAEEFASVAHAYARLGLVPRDTREAIGWVTGKFTR